MKDQPSTAIHGNLVDESDHAYFTASHYLIRISLSEKKCRGRQLNGKEIDAVGDAMGNEITTLKKKFSMFISN